MATLMIWEALPVESVSKDGGTTKSTASLISCGMSLKRTGVGSPEMFAEELESDVLAQVEQRDADAHGAIFGHGVPGKVPAVAGLTLDAGLRLGIDDRHRLVIDLHEVHGDGRNLTDVLRHHVQVGGQQDQGLGFAAPFDGKDLGHGLGVRGVAAEPPDGVGGIEDRTAGAEGLQRLGKDFIAFHSKWQ